MAAKNRSKFSRRTLMMILLLQRKKQSEQRKKFQKKMWVRKIFAERKQKGEFHLLVHDLRLFDSEYFFSEAKKRLRNASVAIIETGKTITNENKFNLNFNCFYCFIAILFK